MAMALWTGNQLNLAEVVTLTVSGVAAGAVLTATINTKAISYTCLVTDTNAAAAAAWQALLAGSGAPPEFQEIQWSVSGAVVTATAQVPGTPFSGVAGNGLTTAGAGGASVALAVVEANVSQSDVKDPLNWSRNNVNALPQNGDTVIVAGSSVPLLWNLDALANVQLVDYQRWQSFTGTIGLPPVNPLGYVEWRVTDLQLAGSLGSSSASGSSLAPGAAGSLTMELGLGATGTGPTRERYSVGASRVTMVARNAGSAADDYNITFLGTNAGNTFAVTNVSLGIAMLPGQTSALAQATVDGGGSISANAGVSWSGALTLINGSAYLMCAPGSINAQQGSLVTVQGIGLVYPSVTAKSGSQVSWLSNSTIGNLVLQTGAIFDKTNDVQPMVVSASTQDGDTTQVLDPNSCITWSNGITFTNAIGTGPVTVGPNRLVRF